MKTMRKLSLAALAVLCCTFPSCSNDESQAGPSSDMATYIFATVNGQDFKTFELNGFLSAQASKEGNVVSITGIDQEQNGMVIGLTGITQPGTYPMSAQQTGNRIGYSDPEITVSSLSPFEGVGGSVVVTAVTDTKIEGTFTMTANDSECSAQTVVTKGSFRGTFAAN